MLNIDPYTILWTLIDLLILFLLMKKFLFKPINAILDSRAKKIQDDTAQAEQLRAEAEQMHQQYEQLLAQRLRQVLENREAPVNRFLDREKAERFLTMEKDYGRPWFGQLMAGPQMMAYLLQVNAWMQQYDLG